MLNHSYKIVEVVGSSSTSIDDAIRSVIAATAKSVKHIDWFQVVETRGHVTDGQVVHFQVTLKLGFKVDVAPTP